MPCNSCSTIREEFWQREGYQSCNISLESEESEDETEDDILMSLDVEDDDERNTRNIQFVLGDVTHPKNTGDNDAIIVHCVGESANTLWCVDINHLYVKMMVGNGAAVVCSLPYLPDQCSLSHSTRWLLRCEVSKGGDCL